MTFKANYLSKTFFIVASLTIGCTGSGMAGCGGDSSGSVPTVESDLIGIYALDSFQASPLDPNTNLPVPDSCDQLSDAPAAGNFLVIYSFVPNDTPETARLGAVFCSSVEECQDVASRAPDPIIGYSFIQGDDASGWTGYGISRTSNSGEMCVADVQIHSLSSEAQSITINTDTVETEFQAEIVGDEATCSNRAALNSLTPDLPCKSRLLLEGTRN